MLSQTDSVIIPVEYTNIFYNQNFFMCRKNNNFVYVIDTLGNRITPEISILNGLYSHSIRLIYTPAKKYTICDMHWKLILNLDYDSARFSMQEKYILLRKNGLLFLFDVAKF